MVTTRSTAKRNVVDTDDDSGGSLDKKPKMMNVKHMDFNMISPSGSGPHIQLITDDLSVVASDSIAIPINGAVNHSTMFLRKFVEFVDDKNYLVKVAEIKKDAGKVKGGHVLHIDMSHSISCPWKHIFLVVQPSKFTLALGYQSLFEKCCELKLASLLLTHINCREKTTEQIVQSAIASLSSVDASSQGNALKYMKVLTICDIKSSVIDVYSNYLGMMVDKVDPLSKTLKIVLGLPLPAASKEEREGRSVTSIVLPENVKNDDCVLCLDELRQDSGPEVCELRKCGHQFHFECFLGLVKASVSKKCCPTCRRYFALPRGNQPKGAQMKVTTLPTKLSGFDHSTGTHVIHYCIPGGIQEASHLRPGLEYSGTCRVAYLPICEEGDKVLKLLRTAFDLRLVFTVGDSITTGAQNVVTWTNIHHKTSTDPGPFGYPDASYIPRVLAELNDAGVTEDLFTQE